MRAGARLVTAGLWLLAMLGPPQGEAQSWPAELSPKPTIGLDVPYLAQSVLLCGGAALAMVERWWGRRGVYAEEYAHLVRPEEGGIRAAELDSAARARGWDSRLLRGTPELARQLLQGDVPLIALIEVRPGRFHYVVVLGWDAGQVVYHDPAASPGTRVAEAEFVAQWAGSGHSALVVQPRTPDPSTPAVLPRLPNPPLAPADSMPCRPWLDRALDAVAREQLDAAASLLDQAARACPAEALVGRELAGVRFKQGRHSETIHLATRYLRAEPNDELAWQLLATSRYLTGDLPGALSAWNRIGRPRVDLVVVSGSRLVPYRTLVAAMGVEHGEVLRVNRLRLAERRLREVPALRHARVGYQAVPGGVVEVQAAVVERPITDPVWRLAGTAVISALGEEAVRMDAASLAGAGERWMAEWRWERARPRATLQLEVPARLGMPGVVTVEGAREGMRIAVDPGAGTIVEDVWRSARVGFGAWLTPEVRPTVAIGLQRWSGERSYLMLEAGTEVRRSADRLRLSLSGAHAVALGDHSPWRRGGIRAMWASSLGLNRAAWSARVGGEWTSAGTPLGGWPVAGGNLSRSIPLRAEPGPRAHLLSGRAAGRTILHGGVSGDLPVYRAGPLVFAVGAFLDGARVSVSADPTIGVRNYLDGGFGIRIGLVGGEQGVVRLDLARGLLADRRQALTVGVHRTWPAWSGFR